jgi:hypothetical protein
MHCLNCNTELIDKYCPHCGQKASTHRFSLRHLFTIDFFHGTFHLNRGLLYTLKALYTKPGHSIREYVQGKRKRHFNCFTLLCFVLTIDIAITHFFSLTTVDLAGDEIDADAVNILNIIMENTRWFTFIKIPVYAWLSFLFFKKAKQNYAEHLVLNTYLICGYLIIGLFYVIIILFSRGLWHNIGQGLATLVALAYPAWFYYQYFSPFYRKKIRLFYRSFVASVIAYICATLVVLLTVGVIVGLRMLNGVN